MRSKVQVNGSNKQTTVCFNWEKQTWQSPGFAGQTSGKFRVLSYGVELQEAGLPSFTLATFLYLGPASPITAVGPIVSLAAGPSDWSMAPTNDCL